MTDRALPIRDTEAAVEQTAADVSALIAQVEAKGLDISTPGMTIGPVKLGQLTLGPWTLPGMTVHVAIGK